ncbi:MAG: thioredoxin fold domain-containing protein [Burkholderiaceae bacterium]|nr:thioredoxin fold domain-containing protein [Burkholderiaceae bacterium]
MTRTRRGFVGALLGLMAVAPAARLAFAASPAPDQAAAAQVLARLGTVSAVQQGPQTRTLVAFFDPNCPYCRQLFQDLQPFIGEDGLGVRWVPVAILAPSSLGKAAAILQAGDRLQAFLAMENHGLNPNLPAPATLSTGQISAQTRQALKTNDAVLKRAGVYYSVPLVVYRDRAGAPQLLLGVPRDAKALTALLRTVGP